MRELVLENNSELAEGDLKDLAKLTKVAEGFISEDTLPQFYLLLPLVGLVFGGLLTLF